MKKILFTVGVLFVSFFFSQSLFGSAGHILNLDTQGKSPLIKRITIIQQEGGRVDWSPSGNNLIAFDKKNADGYYDIYLMDTNGTIVANLTDGNPNINQLHNGNPVWHPFGKYIVFQSEEPQHYNLANKWPPNPGIGVYNNLWAMTPDGKKFWKLTNIPIKKNLFDGIANFGVLNPHFSHDGRKLVWTERYDDCQTKECKWGKWRIKMADFIDSQNGPYLKNEQIVLQKCCSKIGFYMTAMGFSLDDKKILIAGNIDGQDEFGMDQYIFDLTTRHIYNLQNTPQIWEEDCNWTPITNKIIYMTNEGSPLDFDNPDWYWQHHTREYWLMNNDGSNKTRLTYFNDKDAPEYIGRDTIVADSSISPDGKKLVGIIGIDYGDQDKADFELKIVLIEFEKPL